MDAVQNDRDRIVSSAPHDTVSPSRTGRPPVWLSRICRWFLPFLAASLLISAFAHIGDLQRTNRIQHHGTRIAATVQAVHNHLHQTCGRVECTDDWDATIDVTTSRGQASVLVAHRVFYWPGDHIQVLLDPQDAHRAELPLDYTQSVFGPIALFVLAAVAAALSLFAWRGYRRRRRTA